MFVQYVWRTAKLGGGSDFVAFATCANVEDHTTGSEDLVRFQASVRRDTLGGGATDVNLTTRYVAGEMKRHRGAHRDSARFHQRADANDVGVANAREDRAGRRIRDDGAVVNGARGSLTQ